MVKQILTEDEHLVQEYLTRLSPGWFSAAEDEGGAIYADSVASALYAKNIGIRSLLQLAAPKYDLPVLDLLGGSGQIARAASAYSLCDYSRNIITADIEIYQIRLAIADALPAVPLDATDLEILKSDSLASIIISYGIHHISPEERSKLADQAAPKLVKGGTLLLYEAVAGSVGERISSMIVDKLTAKPHLHAHPSRTDLVSMCDHPQLTPPKLYPIFDPQIFLGANADEAIRLARHYYIKHYALPPWMEWSDLLPQLDAVLSMDDGDPVTSNMRVECKRLSISPSNVYIGRT